MKKYILVFFLMLCPLLFSVSASVAEEYADLTLEELLNVSVTSVSGIEQNVTEVPAAIYVISQEDIERSGATELGELFYQVPGMQVKRVDGHRFSIGIREGGQILNNNLLVLIDGVVVFNPSFGGTMWHDLPIALSDIKRIEIIRGSGGTLYSSNAVNGVVNIFTKEAKEIENQIELRAGTQDKRETTLTFGSSNEDKTLSFGGYYKYDFNDGFNQTTDAGKANNDINRHNLAIKGAYEWTDDSKLSAVIRWNHNEANNTGFLDLTSFKRVDEILTASIRFDHNVNDVYNFFIQLSQVEHTITAFTDNDSNVHVTSGEMQHNFLYELAGNHKTSIGMEWRYNNFNTNQSITSNPEKSQKIISYFIHDEYQFAKQWILSSGLRVDDNSHVDDPDLLLAPKLALTYLFNDNHNIYVSGTRAYRTPSIVERDIMITVGSLSIISDPAFEPERAWTYQVGHKSIFLNNKLILNSDFFVSDVRDVYVSNFTGTVLDQINNGEMQTMGFEMEGKYILNSNVILKADYSFTDVQLDPEIVSPEIRELATATPRHAAGLGVRYTKNKFKADLYAKWYDGYHTQPTVLAGNVKIGSYWKTFMRFSYSFVMPEWSNHAEAEAELIVNDVFDARHVEDFSNYFIEPQVYAGIKIKF